MIDDDRLKRFAARLIDQRAARVIIPPYDPSSGHWFGGGNLVRDDSGTLWLVGRYRNHGDSRTGVGVGQRGLELAIFRSNDRGQTFEKAVQFSKSDLNIGGQDVLSIEGSALRLSDRGVDLYVSTEKTGIGYPPELQSYLKPGTGVWSIDKLSSAGIETLPGAEVTEVLRSSDPRFVHLKDPFLGHHRGQECLLFCSHPYCWTSSNTGYVQLGRDGLPRGEACFDFFPRGFTWDVAITRGTALLPLPDGATQLMFYDGGECVRDLDPHASSVRRPRGYSCEELGGLACIAAGDLHSIRRLSVCGPEFVSPAGTGCSRYVDVLAAPEGYYATWQQAQADGSQPLVMNFLARAEAESILWAARGQ